MVKEKFPEKTNYIPHGVPKEIYYPLSDEERVKARNKILGKDKSDHFMPLFVSRNARRKMPSDVLVSWKMFLDRLQEKHGHKKATLLMHTDPLDHEGPNLYHVVETLGIGENVRFSKNRVDFNEMREIYAACDTVVNRSSNEGFGLPTLEAMMCARPIIAIKTGGLTRQVENIDTGEQYGIALEPDVKSLVGNQMVPYIYEDLITHEKLANAFFEMHEWGPEKRKGVGMKALEHAHKDYNINNIIGAWDNTLSDLIQKWENKGKRWEVSTL